MDVISLSPVPAGGFSWRPPFGGHAFVTIAKATFVLRSGRARLAELQQPLIDGDPSSDGLSDWIPFKDRVDVSLVGEPIASEAPKARPVVRRLRVGQLDAKVVGAGPLSWARLNHAANDRRLAELSSDATLLLENLHPHLPRLRCQLPGLRPRAFVERSGSAREVFLQPDTLRIDPAQRRCTVTWRGSFDLVAPDEPGRVLVALEAPDERLTWPDVANLAAHHRDEIADRPSAVRLIASKRGLCPEVPQPDLFDIAVGDDSDDTVVLRRAPSSAGALPFAAPSRLPRAPLPTLPPPSQPPSVRPPATKQNSPWAQGSVSAVRHQLSPPPTGPRAEIPPPPLMLVEDEAPATEREQPAPRSPGHLVVLDPGPRDLLPRLQARWPELFDEPSPPEDDESFDDRMRRVFGAPPPPGPDEIERQIARVVGEAEVCWDLAAAAATATSTGRGEHGIYRAPLVVLEGRLRLLFDEVATLEATMDAVTPHLADHEPLSRQVAIFRKLKRQGAASGAETAADLTARLLDTGQEQGLDRSAIQERAGRQLLRDRRYRERRLLGGSLLEGAIELGSSEPVPCYLPARLRDVLPLYGALDVRLIAALHPRQDPEQPSPHALESLSLAQIHRPEH